ncbi:MAG: dihydrofolate reductase [Acidimicrobiales bacterium]|nr:dihydrofolate reductase [Acidimicrobiales bacterium]RZV45463.1 MAG: dihydrofolate reductase [Acidimicrobiales bacterium]
MTTDGKVVVFIAMSLDGFIATDDGGVGWLDRYNDAGTDFGYEDFIARVGANVQGSKTYEQVLGFDVPYPYEVPSFVVTSRELETPAGADVRFFRPDELPALVAAAREATTKDIWLIGGGQVIRSFLEHRLVDEFIITIMPDVLGSGVPLFPEGTPPSTLRLVRSETFPASVVSLHYTVV